MEDEVKFPSTTVPSQTKKLVQEILDPEGRFKNDVKLMFKRAKIVTADDVTDEHLARAYQIFDEPETGGASPKLFCGSCWFRSEIVRREPFRRS